MDQERIRQYVAGTLTSEDVEAFEDYCVAHPQFARQVELEQRLKAGVAQVALGESAEFSRGGRSLRWRIAAATTIVLTLSAAFLVLHAWSPASGPVMTAVKGTGSAAGSTLRLALVRGIDGTPTLPDGVVRVEIVGLFDADSHYSVALDRLAGQRDPKTLAALDSLQPSTPVTLEVLIDSRQLSAGNYALRVRKQSSIDDPLDFNFLKP
jgi:hypothetical protein